MPAAAPLSPSSIDFRIRRPANVAAFSCESPSGARVSSVFNAWLGSGVQTQSLSDRERCRVDSGDGTGRPWSGSCCRSSDDEPSSDLEQRGEGWYADRVPRVSICIDVPDLKGATTFYCDALGCSIDKEQASHNTLSVGGTTLHLSLKEGGTDATGTGSCARSYERHWTPVHLDFDVDDVDAAVVEVKRLGGTVEGLKRGEWGAAAFCADPFGNGFCLLAIRS